MSVFKEVNATPDFPEMEKNVIKLWDSSNIILRTTRENTDNKPVFSFLEGPPTANGHPGSHHVESRAFKDIVLKYKALRGYHVPRKAGWDTHGLPVELQVEKELGFKTKEDILAYGIAPFNDKCKESVFTYLSEWEEMTERIGFWLDMENPYKTLTNDYIESVWWSLKQVFDKGLLYQGHKILPYCTRCGTALSSHETAQGYKNVEEMSIYIKFKSVDLENTYFLAWTTTPWTLISNLALAINPDEKYVHAKVRDCNYILAKEKLYLIKDQADNEEPEILAELDGADLEGKAYEPLYAFGKPNDPKIHRVILADWVNLEDGSGIVHTAPAFGEDDYMAGMEYDLPMYNPVKLDGEFEDYVTPFAGKFVKDADEAIIEDLESRDLLFYKMQYAHDYPFCWRCDTPLLYYAHDTWFIRMRDVQQELLANNEQISWYPSHLKKGRFGNFLDGIRDWALSRERYWGTPLPVWRCDDEECGKLHAIGSYAELREMAVEEVKEEGFDPHKPYIDDIHLKCPECGKSMTRVPEVIDCWYDSGASTFAQFHYPFENKEEFEARFPYDYISEGVDQTRGWFYTLLAISTLVFDKPAYRNVISVGMVLDDSGEKMSKHKGNIVAPMDVIDALGADALKFYFLSQAPWADKRFSIGQVRERSYPTLNALWGSYFFFTTYANLDSFDPMKPEHQLDVSKRQLVDKWLLSRYNKLIDNLVARLDAYDIHKSAEAISDFVIRDLSNWYVRVNRNRFWEEGLSENKLSALNTLYEVLKGCAIAFSPYITFTSEEIYQNLLTTDPSRKDSVLVDSFPEPNMDLVNEELEKQMALVEETVKGVRRTRERVKLKTRQPLKRLALSASADVSAMLEPHQWIIGLESNVKSVDFVGTNVEEFTTVKLSPNKKALGPVLKGDIRFLDEAFSGLDSADVLAGIESSGSYALKVGETDLNLTMDHLTVAHEPLTRYGAEEVGEVEIYLDTELDKELVLEGLARELVRRIQMMRKEMELDYDTQVSLSITSSDGDILDTVAAQREYITKETLSTLHEMAGDGAHTKEWELDEKVFTISVWT